MTKVEMIREWLKKAYTDWDPLHRPDDFDQLMQELAKRRIAFYIYCKGGQQIHVVLQGHNNLPETTAGIELDPGLYYSEGWGKDYKEALINGLADLIRYESSPKHCTPGWESFHLLTEPHPR